MRIAFLTALMTSVCLMTSGAQALDLSTMSEADRVTLREEIRSYLIENPQVLVEAMDVLQSRQQEDSVKQDARLITENLDSLTKDAASWVGGNLNGDVTVVEFMDYRCGYCRKAYSEIEELVKSDGNIRLVLKEYPILGEDSVQASRFAVAVLQLHGNDAYKAAHDALITMRGTPDTPSLTRIAGDIGLDAQPILDRMNAPEVTQVLAANQELGQTMQINGTPTFVIEGTLLRGYVPLDGMRQIVADERKG